MTRINGYLYSYDELTNGDSWLIVRQANVSGTLLNEDPKWTAPHSHQTQRQYVTYAPA